MTLGIRRIGHVKFSAVDGTAFEVDAIQAIAMFGPRTTF